MSKRVKKIELNYRTRNYIAIHLYICVLFRTQNLHLKRRIFKRMAAS